ncbi:hypothetical protein [Acetobacter sp.]|jgi:hypothetical protein|uniref:hypothetical protein n=1 Tax=Acetobacter sp. TaxID=440 RepID=UPI0025C5B49C|nr:hypothetical protein [Acetobacter sp.]MCH4091079.1 hypothetical protein [Acetobacter sp.]MCI1300262.1 hypothetical protein [Acetobacter sp.]MCI1316070.1 hypothetical protein [Acetobacter sp.]
MPDNNDLHLAQYGAAHVCAAAEISHNTLKNWGSRKPAIILPVDDDRQNVGKGAAIRYSKRRVYQIVATARLVRMGIPVRRAASIAAAFSDFGDETQSGIHRLPGELYPGRNNYLVSFGERDVGIVIEALTGDSLHWAATQTGANIADGFVALPLDTLVARVDATLRCEVPPASRSIV